MSSWSEDCDGSTTLCSVSPESSPTIPSPEITYKRSDARGRTASSGKQKRRKETLPVEDLVFDPLYKKRADEFYKLQEEWGEYPEHARPRSRREELQMLPVLCNDYESFNKQMTYLDKSAESGIQAQIREVLTERQLALVNRQGEAETRKIKESVMPIINLAKKLLSDTEKYGAAMDERGQALNKLGAALDQYSSRVDELALGVHNLPARRPQPKVPQQKWGGRNSF
ncbi:hypothetical protein DENSPDRAFT_162819 [Dentipellis sp. KUC8613]|nr:hypothetical protein DENSPDRAFT_162819 [Dentipellis sp. KUC8613]